MLKKRTTMILGAGASRPYGYPTGVDLKNSLLDAPSEVSAALPDLGLDQQQWQQVQRLIRAFATGETCDRPSAQT